MGLAQSAPGGNGIAVIREIVTGHYDNGQVPPADDSDNLKAALREMTHFYGRMAAPFDYSRPLPRREPTVAQRAVRNVVNSEPMFPLVAGDNSYARAIVKDTEAVTMIGHEDSYYKDLVGSDRRRRLEAARAILAGAEQRNRHSRTIAQKVIRRVVNSKGIFGDDRKKMTASYLAHAFDCRDARHGGQLPEGKKQAVRARVPDTLFAGPYRTACMAHVVVSPDGSVSWKFDERCMRRATRYVELLSGPQQRIGTQRLRHGHQEVLRARG